MRHKGAFALRYLGLLSLLLIGLWILLFAPREERRSENENRMLRAFPVLSAETVASGEFMDGFEEYLSDAFPGRSLLATATDRVLSFFGRKDPEQDIRAQLEAEAAQAGAETTPAPETAAAPPAEATPAPAAEVTPVPEEETAPAPTAAVQTGEARGASIWLIKENGDIHTEESYSAEAIAYLAKVLNEYRDCLPEDGRVLFLNMPVTYIANRITDEHQYVDWDSDVKEALQPLVEEGVYITDPMDTIRPYLGVENLFSAEDHHWHVRAAWRMMEDMLPHVGYVPADFYEFRYRPQYSWDKPALTTEQLQSMTIERENRLLMDKTSPLESYLMNHVVNRTPSVYMDFDHPYGYGVYLGGRQPPWRLFITGYHTGRNALVIGDSFFHAFLPYITLYYDNVHATDPRGGVYREDLVGASIRSMIQRYEIDDVYFITCNYTALDGPVYQGFLEYYLNHEP